MSKEGSDKAGKDISFGVEFFFCCCGIAVLTIAIAFCYHLIR